MPTRKIGLLKMIIASSAMVATVVCSAGDWQLDKEDKGIRLFTKESETSSLKQVKVVTEVKANLTTLVAFLSDNSAFPAWMDKVSKAEKIKDISDKETLTYTVIDSPWPERDRDSVLYSKWTQNPETLVVTKKILSEPQYLNKTDGMVRTPSFEAEWTLIPKGAGVVEVSYTSDFDPGGEMQGWLLNLFTYEMPYNTMRNLRNSSLAQYENVKVAFIKEPILGTASVTH